MADAVLEQVERPGGEARRDCPRPRPRSRRPARSRDPSPTGRTSATAVGGDLGEIAPAPRAGAAGVGAREQQQVGDQAAHPPRRAERRRRRSPARRGRRRGRRGSPRAARGWRGCWSAACAARARRRRRTRAAPGSSPRSPSGPRRARAASARACGPARRPRRRSPARDPPRGVAGGRDLARGRGQRRDRAHRAPGDRQPGERRRAAVPPTTPTAEEEPELAERSPRAARGSRAYWTIGGRDRARRERQREDLVVADLGHLVRLRGAHVRRARRLLGSPVARDHAAVEVDDPQSGVAGHQQVEDVRAGRRGDADPLQLDLVARADWRRSAARAGSRPGSARSRAGRRRARRRPGSAASARPRRRRGASGPASA